ncbi:hypothetical protein [Pseudonocardia sp.]
MSGGWVFNVAGLDPDEYRAELVEMGASDEDADVAVAALRERDGGDR